MLAAATMPCLLMPTTARHYYHARCHYAIPFTLILRRRRRQLLIRDYFFAFRLIFAATMPRQRWRAIDRCYMPLITAIDSADAAFDAAAIYTLMLPTSCVTPLFTLLRFRCRIFR